MSPHVLASPYPVFTIESPLTGSPLIIIGLIRNESALICFSAGRPVDSVIWSDNGAIIDFANSNFSSQQYLIGNLQAAYANVLYKEDGKLEGSYTCQLDDADPDSDPVSWTYTVNGMDPLSFRGYACISIDRGISVGLRRSSIGGPLSSVA